MNPNLAWEEAQAKLADFRKEAARRHMEGEAHRACSVCGLNSDAGAEHCQHCGNEFSIGGLKWSRRSKS